MEMYKHALNTIICQYLTLGYCVCHQTLSQLDTPPPPPPFSSDGLVQNCMTPSQNSSILCRVVHQPIVFSKSHEPLETSHSRTMALCICTKNLATKRNHGKENGKDVCAVYFLTTVRRLTPFHTDPSLSFRH